jgi:GAF domain-containing protein
VYLLNEAGDTLVLAAGSGEPGRRMAAEKRSIPLNQERSLVARAAREKQGVIANDVRSESDFLPNPFLPETRSELAVPLLVGDRVLGVFDVQSDQVNRFTNEDVNIQSTLASQIAIAMQNARAFTQAQRQAEREATLNLIGQKIQSTVTVEAALQVAARELGRALGAPLTIAQLGLKSDQGNSN